MQVNSGGLSWGKSTFSGKTTKKEFSFTLGGVHNTEEGVSPVLAWSFDTDKIKQPLFSFLESPRLVAQEGTVRLMAVSLKKVEAIIASLDTKDVDVLDRRRHRDGARRRRTVRDREAG